MRGKLLRPDTPVREPRITPAHAGKTLEAERLYTEMADHPRACGENTSEMAYFRG